MFKQAISIDNILVKYTMQDQPNAALIAMSLAQKNASPTARMYQQHMQQATMLWSQLSAQTIEMACNNLEASINIGTSISSSIPPSQQ